MTRQYIRIMHSASDDLVALNAEPVRNLQVSIDIAISSGDSGRTVYLRNFY